MDVKEEIFESIQYMVDKSIRTYKADRTYRSAIKAITSKGYVIIDKSGAERTVRCCIPGVELKVGQNVWVKVPEGDLNGIHICGVV